MMKNFGVPNMERVDKMINLQFGKYGIKTADERNIILTENVIITKENSKNFGKEFEKVLGYYSNLECALKAYINRALADEDTNINTAELLLDKYEKLHNNITEAIQCTKTS